MACNAVFEGGGAKGIAHIGALKAIENYGLKIDKAAGTSAGAIIASLIALGYSADELYNPETGKGKLPTSLNKIVFNFPITCSVILKILVIISPYFYLENLFSFSPLLIIISTLVASLLLFNLSKKIRHTNRKFPRALFASILMSCILLLIIPVIIPATFCLWGFGLISTKGIEKWLEDTIDSSPKLIEKNKHLKNKIEGKHITFLQLYDITGFHLKLISSDIGTREITIFSHENVETRDLRLIDGIIASIAIPLVFKCKKIIIQDKTYQFVDGGMLSNFPAWIHRKHLLLDDLKHTVGIKLSKNVKERKDVDNPICYLKNISTTALWGTSPIENISVKGLNLINIDTGRAKTIPIYMRKKEITKLYNAGHTQTQGILENNYALFPDGEVEKWLKEISNSLAVTYSAMANLHVNESNNSYSGNLDLHRASLIASIDTNLNTKKIIYHYNMKNDLDKHLEFDGNEGVSGLCLKEGLPIFYQPENNKYRTVKDRYINAAMKDSSAMHVNRQALVKKDLKIIIAIPIFNIDELDDKHIMNRGGNNLSEINFSELKNSAIKPKAVVAIDFSDDFLYDKNNNVIPEFYNDSTLTFALPFFSFIASTAISELSKKNGENTYEK